MKILDAPKKIGLTMTEGNMLTPLKSVTAVIGLKRNEKVVTVSSPVQAAKRRIVHIEDWRNDRGC